MLLNLMQKKTPNRKRCSYCKRRRLIKFFSKNRAMKDGLHHYCRDCKSICNKKYYRKDPKRWSRHTNSRRQQNRQSIAIIKEQSPCTDCQQYFPACVMDFDHITTHKTLNISKMVHYSWKKILEEMNRCELVCANCHRLRTHLSK